ncbi:MAG TPA: formylmethanofuran dehydrogenase subunit B, partial [Methanothrix sp.]|nr:formylmethanofuran dehydrogenase subunit B [Methanothrix sp.]
MNVVIKNVICPVCGASCDDIQVELDGGRLTVKNACKMGNAKFHELVSAHRIREPMMTVGGEKKAAAWNEAIDRAAEILAEAKRPLLFMGSETSCEAMEVG